jgi:endonuclease G
MKTLITILLFPLLTLAQLRDSVKVKTSIYEIVYSEILESPLRITYTVQCTNGTASRAGMDFYTEKGIHTSDGKDYVDNVWDKGHMAPAADFNCTKEMLKQTFSYVNCALQDQYLNRGVWKTLEAQEREWAKTEMVSVYIKVVFTKECIEIPTGATIPMGFFKTIYLHSSKKTYLYFFANIKPTRSSYTEYLINSK